MLIAAIHHREYGGDLNYSMTDGSEIGKSNFVADAVKTIKSGQWRDFQNAIGMGKGTRNLLAMLQFAELWNGKAMQTPGESARIYMRERIFITKGKYLKQWLEP